MQVEIIQIDPNDLKLLDENPHFMKPAMYRQLVTNIRRDGALSSVPFACLDGDNWLVLSGNHRVMAAIDAGLETIDVMVTRDALTQSERLAIQLSHNSIFGEDDPELLKRLYEGITDVDLRQYSGLDDNFFDDFDPLTVEPLSEASLDFRSVNLLFLPGEPDRMTEALKEALELMSKHEEVWAARLKDYVAFGDAIDEVGAAYNVRNMATLMMLMLGVLDAHIEDLKEGWENTSGNSWVPIASIFGNRYIPVKVAKLVNKAVAKMMSTKQLDKTTKWQALEQWATAYLEGSDASVG